MTETPYEAMQEMYGDDLPQCDVCGDAISDDCYYVDPGYICQDCFASTADEHESDARAFVAKNLKITTPLPRFDRSTAWTISRADYEYGDRVSNTENAYRTQCRHKHTNYDELIAKLSKDSSLDNVWYAIVRAAADEMIDDEIIRKDLIVDSSLD